MVLAGLWLGSRGRCGAGLGRRRHEESSQRTFRSCRCWHRGLTQAGRLEKVLYLVLHFRSCRPLILAIRLLRPRRSPGFSTRPLGDGPTPPERSSSGSSCWSGSNPAGRLPLVPKPDRRWLARCPDRRPYMTDPETGRHDRGRCQLGGGAA